MPYCPRCEYEYAPGVETCPDCGARLVDELPEERWLNREELDHGKWIAVARLKSSQYAEMILEALRAKSIPAVILSSTGYFGRTGQMGISAFLPIAGSYSVMVPREYAEDADQEGETILGDEWRASRTHRPE